MVNATKEELLASDADDFLTTYMQEREKREEPSDESIYQVRFFKEERFVFSGHLR